MRSVDDAAVEPAATTQGQVSDEVAAIAGEFAAAGSPEEGIRLTVTRGDGVEPL